MGDVKSNKIEDVILNQLIWNNKFFGRVIPFMKEEYFDDPTEKKLITHIIEHFNKYDSKIPDVNVLRVLIEGDTNCSESSYKEILEYTQEKLESSLTLEEVDEPWLLDASEKFCKDKAVYNAIVRSISIIEGKEKGVTTDILPDLLEEALSVSFDNDDIGHQYIENAEERYNLLHQSNTKYPCSLKAINKVTNGGFEEKTLNMFIGSVGSGKSIMLAQLAKDYIEDGFNVLFITLEMASEKIATRVDANSMNININRLPDLDRAEFLAKIHMLKNKSKGKLVIKEYPPGSAHCGHFESLMKELKLKKNFVPKIIIVDYLGIMSSKKVSPAVGLYSFYKNIAEELRGFMIKHEAVGFSVQQFNRGSAFSTDANISGIADSQGVINTVDFAAGLLVNDDLIERMRVILLQMKNRYGELSSKVNPKKQLIGLDTNYMRYMDCEQEELEILVDKKKKGKGAVEEEDIPLFDQSTNGATLPVKTNKYTGKQFTGINFS